MIRTHGLTHISLTVTDVKRSAAFYTSSFGGRVYAEGEGWAQIAGPGPNDVMALEQGDPSPPPHDTYIRHFGFRLVSADDIDGAVDELLANGGTLVKRGEHAPGFPYAYVRDPDGYEIEVWYE